MSLIHLIAASGLDFEACEGEALTIAGVRKWLVGVGCGGKLLTVYEATTYRGDVRALEQVHGEYTPDGVTEALREFLEGRARLEWVG